MASAWADGTTVTFRVPDPGYRLAGVRLSQDVRIPLEYLLELRYPDGGAETVTDPGNPRQVDGAFGPTQALKQRGYPAELHELPDMHNYTAWRDGFDPHLTRLLGQVCG